LSPEPERGPERPEFEILLEQSIEDGLREVLGQSGLQMVVRLCPLDRLSTDPAAFHEALKAIFMENGAVIIEREIARRLLDRLGADWAGEGRLHRWWVANGSSSSAKGPQGASAREKKVLREFVALSALPRGHSTEGAPRHAEGAREAISLELTSIRFGAAFKKGS
jgi:hypothetical protein